MAINNSIVFVRLITHSNSCIVAEVSVQDQRFALKKIPHRNQPQCCVFCHLLHNEYKIVSQLQHPHILPAYAYSAYSEHEPGLQCGMLMELASCDLFQYMDRFASEGTRIPLATMRSVLRQLSEAVAYLHARRLAHNDIKLKNIFLFLSQGAASEPAKSSAPAEVLTKLADFGFARYVGDADSLAGQSAQEQCERWRIRTQNNCAPEILTALLETTPL